MNIDDADVQKKVKLLRLSDINLLAPKMIMPLRRGISECNKNGIDVMVAETLRTNELQEIYFECGSSKAKTVEKSYHGYGLAVDLKSKLLGYNVTAAWWSRVADILEKLGFVWGGRWKSIKDTPHFQWVSLRDIWVVPTKNFQFLLSQGRIEEVQRIVGAR